MTFLDLIAFGVIVFSLLRTNNPKQYSMDVIASASMGGLGIATGTMAASMFFGQRNAVIHPENILFALLGIFFLFILGNVLHKAA